jgi:hypothetical protein
MSIYARRQNATLLLESFVLIEFKRTRCGTGFTVLNYIKFTVRMLYVNTNT